MSNLLLISCLYFLFLGSKLKPIKMNEKLKPIKIVDFFLNLYNSLLIKAIWVFGIPNMMWHATFGPLEDSLTSGTCLA